MGFLPPLLTMAAQTVGSVAGQVSGAAASVGHAIGSTATTILGGAGGMASGGVVGGGSSAAASGLSKAIQVGGLAATGLTIAQALNPPKPPPIPTAPTMPNFAAGLTGGANRSLASQSPLLALGGTSSGPIGAPSGGKTLLGQ